MSSLPVEVASCLQSQHSSHRVAAAVDLVAAAVAVLVLDAVVVVGNFEKKHTTKRKRNREESNNAPQTRNWVPTWGMTLDQNKTPAKRSSTCTLPTSHKFGPENRSPPPHLLLSAGVRRCYIQCGGRVKLGKIGVTLDRSKYLPDGLPELLVVARDGPVPWPLALALGASEVFTRLRLSRFPCFCSTIGLGIDKGEGHIMNGVFVLSV